MKNTLLKIAAVVLALLLFGCGYHNPYLAKTNGDRIASVYMTLWENKTNELGLENLIFSSTADWLQQSRHLQITKDKTGADYLLTGTILSVNYPATAYSVTDVASTLKAEVRTSYQLTELSTGKTIWRVDETLRQKDYPAGTNAVRSQSNKREAFATIADEVGEQIYLRITATLTEQ